MGGFCSRMPINHIKSTSLSKWHAGSHGPMWDKVGLCWLLRNIMGDLSQISPQHYSSQPRSVPAPATTEQREPSLELGLLWSSCLWGSKNILSGQTLPILGKYRIAQRRGQTLFQLEIKPQQANTMQRP